jgi:hypothetical protein
VLLTLFVGRETGPPPPEPQTQSVAGAALPPKASTSPPPERSASSPTTRSTPATPAAVPTKPPVPAGIHAAALPGQTFVWVAAPKAAAYEFQLFQAGERIFRARVNEPRLQLPGRWRQGGHPYALLPGDYRWYVWPVSVGAKHQSSVAIVQAKLVIEGKKQ